MKFNKDVFLNEIVEKVQSAIDKNLITQEDVEKNDIERLHGFVQYELLKQLASVHKNYFSIWVYG